LVGRVDLRLLSGVDAVSSLAVGRMAAHVAAARLRSMAMESV
jgi:hypothetical protein